MIDKYNDRHQLYDELDDLHAVMQNDYEKIHRRDAGRDNKVAGDKGENSWLTLLRNWFPQFNYLQNVAIVFDNGISSNEIDIVMLRADYPKPLLERKIVLADGVFAAFECKLRLYTEHFVSVLEKAKSVKELASKAYMHDAFHHLHGKFPYVLLAHSHEWDRPNSKPYENFISQVVDSVPSVAGHPAFALDFACIADLATYAAKPLPFLAGERKVLSDPGAFVTTLLTGSTYNPIGLLIIELNRRLGSLGLVDPWLSTTIMRTTEVGSVMEVHKNHRWPTSAFPPDLINKMRANQLNSVFRAGAAYIKMHPDWSPFPEGG